MNAKSGTSAPASVNLPWLKAYPEGIDWAMPLEPRPLTHLLDTAARDYPHNPAISFKGKVQTYVELAGQVATVAAGLQSIGVNKGTRVGLFLPNTPAFIIYYFAILKAGGTVVNFNPLYTLEELTFQVRDSGTEIMVTHDLKVLFDKVEALIGSGVLARSIVVPFAPMLPAATAVLFKLFKRKDMANISASKVKDQVIPGAALSRKGRDFRPVAINPLEDVAVLQYTGGTTGTPKAAMLTHANLLANAEQINAWATGLIQGQERVLGVLPLFHVFAMTVVMNMGIAKAANIILMPRFQLDEALKLITKEKPTMMPAVPTIFTAMNNHPKAQEL